MKRILVAAAVVGSILASGVAEAQQPITLRFSSFEPPVAFITKQILTPWAEQVSKDSEGTLKVEMFPGGTLGRDPAGQLKLVMDGVADIAWIVPGYTPGRFDAATIVEVPFLLQSAYEASVASTRMHEKGLFAGGGFDDVKLLCVCANNPVFVNTTFPAKSLGDLKGKKMRAAGPISLSLVNALGAVPVGGITGGQLAESLSRGLVDGTLNEWNALQTFRVLEVTKNHIIAPLGSTSLMVVMNKKKYESLPPAAKAAIDKHSGEAFAKTFGSMFDQNNAAVSQSARKDKDRTILELDEPARREWQAAVANIGMDWQKSRPNGEQIYKAFLEELAAIRANK
jgi:TRAP-type C4-dicarboxylate transport system substrate-binding protein